RRPRRVGQRHRRPAVGPVRLLRRPRRQPVVGAADPTPGLTRTPSPALAAAQGPDVTRSESVPPGPPLSAWRSLRVLPPAVFHSMRPLDVRPSITIAAVDGEVKM